MPALSAEMKRKLAAKKLDSGVVLSDAAKNDRRVQREKKKEQEQEQGGAPQWLLMGVGAVVLGSIVAQMYFNVMFGPSMSN
jgi:hypothetical protein